MVNHNWHYQVFASSRRGGIINCVRYSDGQVEILLYELPDKVYRYEANANPPDLRDLYAQSFYRLPPQLRAQCRSLLASCVPACKCYICVRLGATWDKAGEVVAARANEQ